MVCSDKIIRVNLGLLKPLWHLYLKLMAKYDPTDSNVRPPLLMALTELFLAVETAAEVWIMIYATCVCNCSAYSSRNLMSVNQPTSQSLFV